MLEAHLIKSLQDFNERIKRNYQDLPQADTLRDKISLFGRFIYCNKIDASRIPEFTECRPVVAVDGSRIEYASFFPYSLVFMRTLAKCTGGSDITRSGIISPLNLEVYNQLEKISDEQDISLEEAYTLHLKYSLAYMELLTALEAAKTYKPYMLMLDGGFLLFDRFEEWEELRRVCIENKIILTGIIEEIATAELANWLDLNRDNRIRIYDREVLFGILEVGEYLIFNSDRRIKKDYCTVFARLGTSPQAIGCDFLSEQEDDVFKSMDFIYTLTPKSGQGIPLWLQITDARVRIKREEAEKLVENYLDPYVKEKIFKANRKKRAF
ncbi:DNA double-strand break repair nuclease NurA [Thermosyntropha sp.]|uniref:DNA double-strand break repair nuclease NurA n=1 Tax=Thermosyntropha sp. TaxID=2740820 RepID=UPI0025E5ED7F|nr:DNA double-strand break repair nuclease NurA [Thermosyntropha sp.]MBO8158355.1 DNA double-strand break repair nuclease NurA [Thermosyntropha sp.]